MDRPLTVGLLGDVMLGRGVGAALERVPPEGVWGPELRALCRECDVVIGNLECCLSERGSPTERVRGKPFFFRGPPSAVAALGAIGMRAAGLANNHALDYEAQALEDTLGLLAGAGIVAAGAGSDEAAARRGRVIEAGGLRVGLIAFSDHPREFAAGAARPGIAYCELDWGVPDWLGTEIERLGEECDAVVAFPHWGPNLTLEPAPWQLQAASELAAAGADLVAGHSAHCFHGVGWSERGPIAYDLGGAIDDYDRSDRRARLDAGLMALWRPGGAEPELELVGLHLDHCHAALSVGEHADWIAGRLEGACASLGTVVERVAEGRFRIAPC